MSVPAGARQQLTRVAEATEKFYFGWMNHWGYPPGATNLFKRDSDGMVELLEVRGDKPVASGKYAKPNFADDVIKQAMRRYKISGKEHVWWIFVYLGDRPARFNDFAGAGNPRDGGWAMVNYDTLPGQIIPEQGLVEGYNGKVFLKGMVHELGHAFGLPHEGPEPELALGNSLMGPVTTLYVARKYPKPDQVYLNEAAAAMLWKHPVFAGRDFEGVPQFNVSLLDYQAKFNSTNDSISLSGKLAADKPAHTVLVIDDSVPHNEYWHQIHSVRISTDGTFQVTIKHPSKTDGRFRILFCFENGIVSGDGVNFRFVNRGDIIKPYRFKDGEFEFEE